MCPRRARSLTLSSALQGHALAVQLLLRASPAAALVVDGRGRRAAELAPSDAVRALF